MISGPKCIVCKLGIPEHIPYVGWVVRAEQRTGIVGNNAVVATNDMVIARFHEGCYQATLPALNKFMKMLAG